MIKANAIERARRVDDMARMSHAMAETLDRYSREGPKANSELGLARSSLLMAARHLEMAHDALKAREPGRPDPDPNPMGDSNDPVHRRD